MTDLERWVKNRRLHPSWDGRNVHLASFIPPDSSVLDVGAGAETLRRHLAPKRCFYHPIDVATTDAERFVEFNAKILPKLPRYFDVVVVSGVLEYVVNENLEFFLQTVPKWGKRTLLSYAVRKDAQYRESNGWLSNHTSRDLEKAFDAAALTSSRLPRWRGQWIWALQEKCGVCGLS